MQTKFCSFNGFSASKVVTWGLTRETNGAFDLLLEITGRQANFLTSVTGLSSIFSPAARWGRPTWRTFRFSDYHYPKTSSECTCAEVTSGCNAVSATSLYDFTPWSAKVEVVFGDVAALRDRTSLTKVNDIWADLELSAADTVTLAHILFGWYLRYPLSLRSYCTSSESSKPAGSNFHQIMSANSTEPHSLQLITESQIPHGWQNKLPFWRYCFLRKLWRRWIWQVP